VDAVEFDETNLNYLKDYDGNIEVFEGDFLKMELSEYDRIFANPPFTNNADIDHILKMYDCLSRGGEMVSLSSTSWQRGSQKKQKEFQKFIEDLQEKRLCEIEKIPAGAFKKSGTNIPTLLIWIKKNGFHPQKKDNGARNQKNNFFDKK